MTKPQMTKRFILYIVGFNLLIALAALPPLVTLVAEPEKGLFLLFGVVTVPPLTITGLAWSAIQEALLPGGGSYLDIHYRPIMAVLAITSCVLYYGFLFVAFLPAGLRRGQDLPLPIRWRYPWKVFAAVLVNIHVVWAVAGMIYIALFM